MCGGGGDVRGRVRVGRGRKGKGWQGKGYRVQAEKGNTGKICFSRKCLQWQQNEWKKWLPG